MTAEVSSGIPAALAAVLARARTLQASDVHVEPAEGVALRAGTRIERLGGATVREGDVTRFIEATLDRRARLRLDKFGTADAVYADPAVGAIRVHASRGRNGCRLAIRLLAQSVPSLESLRLPPIVATLLDARHGITILCGPGGSGKSTTAAALLQRVNETSARHLVSIESPVEHVLPWDRSIVTQYEVGRDVATFAHGVRGALRADPDVLFVGAVPDSETALACLQAAESGRLVLAALDAPPEVPLAIGRYIGLFPLDEQDRMRGRLAETLRAALALRLVPLRHGVGLRPVAELLIVTDAVRRLLRDGATHQLRATLGASRRAGMQTLEAHLCELVAAGEVDAEVARAIALHPEELRGA